MGPIAEAIGIDPRLSGLIVGLPQLGYVFGLVLVAPLGDVLENRRLVSALFGVAGLALIGMAMAPSDLSFLSAALVVGLASAGTQVIVAFAASLAPDEARGRIVGYITSGVFLGILLARPAASLITYYLSWRVTFLIPAILMAASAVALHVALPARPAQAPRAPLLRPSQAVPPTAAGRVQ
jgi:MFS family permease